jgi:uncharacterized protein (TIGR00725 family)
MLKIAVVGASQCDDSSRDDASAVGHAIAAAGAILLCGGGAGVMEAAAKGARAAGGRTIGILPGTGPEESPPNPFIEIPIYTGMGQARNLVLVLSADAIIAVGGEWGTLSEIAMAMKHDRPLVLLGSWNLEPPRSREIATPQSASTPQEAVRLALDMITSTPESQPAQES